MPVAFLKFTAGTIVPKSCIIAVAALNAANQIGLDCTLWVTSGNDRVHMRGSKHYTDDALDFRTKHLTTTDKHAWRKAILRRLGNDYQAILEYEGQTQEHLHVEHDPPDRRDNGA